MLSKDGNPILIGQKAWVIKNFSGNIEEVEIKITDIFPRTDSAMTFINDYDKSGRYSCYYKDELYTNKLNVHLEIIQIIQKQINSLKIQLKRQQKQLKENKKIITKLLKKD